MEMVLAEYTKPKAMSPEKPIEHPNKPNNLSSVESFFGIFKNIFGCFKNFVDPFSNVPPQLAPQLPQSIQMPQQVSCDFLHYRMTSRWRGY
jgi:hypothetical protein